MSTDDARLAALERQVAALTAEVASLRDARGPAAASPSPQDVPPPDARGPHLNRNLADRLRMPPRDDAPRDDPPRADPPHAASFGERMHSGAAISGDELESMVGRYVTLAVAALVILMAVGAVIKAAVEKGLLTPEVRVIGGALAAVAVAAAGVVFRRRGDVRYGSVLLAISLAMVDLVAWGAGPRLHLIPTTVALGVVDVVAIALAALALYDGSEFLFAIAVAGALSAPFVTSDGGGTALALLLYGGTVLAGALRAARDPSWMRAFAVLVGGALVYALAAAALPISASWYGPLLVSLFCVACAGAALLFGEEEWKSELPRAYLAVGIVGVLAGWDAMPPRPASPTLTVAVLMAAVTYGALAVRGVRDRYWTSSAILLPFLSLGIAHAGARGDVAESAVFIVWTLFALVAWRLETRQGDSSRAGTHLLSASLMGVLGITTLLWDYPLPFVAALAGWAVVLAALGRDERSSLPLVGVAIAGGAAAISAVDQLASRSAYSYTPFLTRSSGSAACAAVGLAAAAYLISGGAGRAKELAGRAVRVGVVVGFLIVWGRMELAHAFNRDLAAFLLTSYYAACGVASIIAGRRLGIAKLRATGLALALYAGFKGVVQVTDIDSVALRVGAFAAVGVFLLGGGYLYREVRQRAELA
jgi:uncharacterized membrane protein